MVILPLSSFFLKPSPLRPRNVFNLWQKPNFQSRPRVPQALESILENLTSSAEGVVGDPSIFRKKRVHLADTLPPKFGNMAGARRPSVERQPEPEEWGISSTFPEGSRTVSSKVLFLQPTFLCHTKSKHLFPPFYLFFSCWSNRSCPQVQEDGNQVKKKKYRSQRKNLLLFLSVFQGRKSMATKEEKKRKRKEKKRKKRRKKNWCKKNFSKKKKKKKKKGRE